MQQQHMAAVAGGGRPPPPFSDSMHEMHHVMQQQQQQHHLHQQQRLGNNGMPMMMNFQNNNNNNMSSGNSSHFGPSHMNNNHMNMVGGPAMMNNNNNQNMNNNNNNGQMQMQQLTQPGMNSLNSNHSMVTNTTPDSRAAAATTTTTSGMMVSVAVPEADGLLVNILLYDTSLNIYRDHNFNSCTICVCNANKKCVGNIRGSESGVYLALPGTSFEAMTAALSEGGSGGGEQRGQQQQQQQALMHNNNSFNGAFGGIGGCSGMDLDSPPAGLSTGGSASTSNNNNGYMDEDPIRCQCGFSAVVNRRLAHSSGLFYEDEMEITGMAIDPAVYKKRSILSFVMEEMQQQQQGNNSGVINNTGKDTNNNMDSSKLNMILHIKQEPQFGGSGGGSGGSRSGTPLDSQGTNSSGGGGGGGGQGLEMGSNNNNCDNSNNNSNSMDVANNGLPLAIMDLLREQCATVVQSSANSILRAIRRFRGTVQNASTTIANVNVLEFTEAQDIIAFALEQARIVYPDGGTIMANHTPPNHHHHAMVKMEMDVFGSNGPAAVQSQMMRIHNGPLSSSSSSQRGGMGGGSSCRDALQALDRRKKVGGAVSVHKWPYVKTSGPRSNQDIIRLMKSMQPLLQDAFHRKSTTRLWDAPYTVKGPLTWRQFHRLASSSTTGQCEPQPIPSIIVGHEKDWLSVAPYALHYWDKLLLEPYSYARDVAYIVIAPDNDSVIAKTRAYFKELSTTYEMCKLGHHMPIKGWDGIFRVGKQMKHINGVTNERPESTTMPSDEWFNMLGDHKIAESLKLYAQACQSYIVPYLSKVPSDKSLLDPPESYIQNPVVGPYGTNASSAVNIMNRSQPSPMLPPSTPEPNTQQQSTDSNDDGLASTSGGTGGGGGGSGVGNSALPPTESLSQVEQDDTDPPCVVVYIVEPFSCGNDSAELHRFVCLALLRCYSNMLSAIPDSIRSNITFQVGQPKVHNR